MKITKKITVFTIIPFIILFSTQIPAEDNIGSERKAQHTMESADADNDGINDHLDWCPNTPINAAVDNEGCPIDSDRDGVYDFRDKCPGSSCVAVDNEGCPIDSDGDGVTDFLDSCADTPAGIGVDKKGCPKDSDGDGVYDGIDECPDTPRSLIVDERGCPKDSDGDGVYDGIDECPDTPRGDVVNEVGCTILTEVKDEIDLHVEFEFDKAQIKSVYSEHLQRVSEFLKKYPDTLAIIEGHTDGKGSDVYNMGLSLRRAESVRSYLITNYGVSPLRLKAIGNGESMPVADNTTDEGRQRNRRTVAVLATIIKKPVKKIE